MISPGPRKNAKWLYRYVSRSVCPFNVEFARELAEARAELRRVGAPRAPYPPASRPRGSGAPICLPTRPYARFSSGPHAIL